MATIIGTIVIWGFFIALFLGLCFLYMTLPMYLGTQMGKEKPKGYFAWLKQDNPFE